MYEFEKHQRLTEFIQEMANTGKAPQEWTSFIETLNQALRIHDVSGSLGFDKGYEQGYNDATREACQEIAKNYQPNDR